MATIIPTSLTRYSLTEEEYGAGSALTIAQKYVIQNLLADACEEKLSLVFNPIAPHEFQQREAELQGTIGAYNFLLAQSEEFEILQREKLRQSQET